MYLPTVSLYKHKSLTFNVTKLTHSHMPHSHHSHSGQFCLHAAQGTTLEQVVQEAIKKGFKTYGLTEHCPRYRQQDLYPEEVSWEMLLIACTGADAETWSRW